MLHRSCNDLLGPKEALGMQACAGTRAYCSLAFRRSKTWLPLEDTGQEKLLKHARASLNAVLPSRPGAVMLAAGHHSSVQKATSACKDKISRRIRSRSPRRWDCSALLPAGSGSRWATDR
jgi:hypothetical protein